MEEHKIIEDLLKTFRRKYVKVGEIDDVVYPFSAMNATFIGKYKHSLSPDIKGDYLLIDGVVSNNSIGMYYKFMDEETKLEHKDLLKVVHSQRWKDIVSFMEKEGLVFETEKGKDYDILSDNYDFEKFDSVPEPVTYYKWVSYFGIKDELKPINNYIEEIKNSDNFKKCIEQKALGVFDSFSKNLKESINDVSASDFLLKTPKGVALEVGLKTLKGTASDVLNGIKDECLSSLVKNYENHINPVEENTSHEKVGISKEEYIRILKRINSYEHDICESNFKDVADITEDEYSDMLNFMEDENFDIEVVEKVMLHRKGNDYNEGAKLDSTYVEEEYVEFVPFDYESFYKDFYKNLEKYKSICSYESPFIKNVQVNDETITFGTERWVGADAISSNTVFDLNGNLLNADNFEKQYIKEKSESVSTKIDVNVKNKITKQR